MNKQTKWLSTLCLLVGFSAPLQAKIEGSLDPDCVVAEWSNSSTYPKVIDINFSDLTWPDTWKGQTGVDCPPFSAGGYINYIKQIAANPSGNVSYPILFHNCTFANKKSAGGHGGATAAFSRIYYLGQKPSGNSATRYNNWTVTGHTKYLEDNITYDSNGKPNYGEAGFVQMCRDASQTTESQHGWMEIDHIPYVERVQWSWSSTSWGRGIKCDYKVGDGEWKPLVWMGSESQKQGYTVFSDQGYFMENVINASDVSLRWRVWDGDDPDNPVLKADGSKAYRDQGYAPLAQKQAPRVHKIQIFGNEITAQQAQYAKEHPLADVGEISDLGDADPDKKEAPDTGAPVVLLTVAQDGTADYTKIQEAINAVPDGSRGIIYVRKGTYDENLYAGTKDQHNKFISLIGEDRDQTILTSSVSRGTGNEANTYNDCAALNVFTPCFYAENLTIRNTSGNVGQAEALYTNADAHVFKNCLLSGYQDTYKANVGNRGYFTNCTIEGATDFIYDGGLEWFDDCELRCVKGSGYITAPASSAIPMTQVLYPELSQTAFYPGLFFRGCTITAEDGVADGAYTLGRPWDEKSGAMFLQCKLGKHINTKGWTEWNGRGSLSSLYEYKNMNADGTLAATSGRASFSHQATDKEVEAYMNPEFMFAKMSDVPFDYASVVRGAAAPMNFVTSPTELSWESDDQAAGYLVYKDGTFHSFTDKASIALASADEATAYSVRSVSRQGVVSKLVKASEAQKLKAFPSAEGFGKFTTGGRGGKVVTVTKLADDGSEGTLRWAFSQYKDEPLTIVFAVSGNIELRSALRIQRADWTLAGQTAPGEGISLIRNKVNLGGSQNFIVRNVRFRAGQLDVNNDKLQDQALGVENCSNFIFDHCTFGWSMEENMNTQDSHFLTVQNSIVHEGLYNAGHAKGVRGYGVQWGGSPATYCRNLLADNQSRSPRINGARGEDNVVFMEYINNVNYNFGKNGGCYGGENTADISSYNGENSAHECNFMNNYYKPGNASNEASKVIFVNSSYARDGATSWAPAQWYVNGNVIEGNAAANADNWTAMAAETYSLDQIRVNSRIVPKHAYYKYSATGNVGNYDPNQYMLTDILPANDAYDYVLNYAGTINRDQVERRVVDEARTGTSHYGGTTLGKTTGIIDTEADCEGFLPLSTDWTAPVDTDGDGMPDEWEQAHGLDPHVADQNKVNADGYTALEAYLCSLMGETLKDGFSTGIKTVATASPQVGYDRSSDCITVSDNALGGMLYVYSANGSLLSVQTISKRKVSLAGIGERMAIAKVEGRGISPRIVKIMR